MKKLILRICMESNEIGGISLWICNHCGYHNVDNWMTSICANCGGKTK